MPFLIFVIAFGLNYYKDDLKYIEAVKYASESPKIAYDLDNSNSNQELSYVPYIESFTTLEVSTKDIGLSLSVKNKKNDSEKEAGEELVKESNAFDIQLLGVKDHYLWEFSYQNYQGLYITDDVDALDNSLNHADAWSYGFSMTRFLNREFDPKKSFLNLDKDKISNWSWVFGAHFTKNKLYSNDGLIPDIFKASFAKIQDIREIETTNLGLDFGATGLYTNGNWYISALLTYGILYQQQELKGLETPKQDRSATLFHLLFNTGYRFYDHHTIGLNIYTLANTIFVEDSTFNVQRTMISVYWKSFF